MQLFIFLFNILILGSTTINMYQHGNNDAGFGFALAALWMTVYFLSVLVCGRVIGYLKAELRAKNGPQ